MTSLTPQEEGVIIKTDITTLSTEESDSDESVYVQETKLELFEKLEQLKNNKPKAASLIIKWKKAIKSLEEELK